MFLAKRLKHAFSKMLLFDGSLSFSPNTLNNAIMTYALAKKWEQRRFPYNDWLTLIDKVCQFSKDFDKALPSDMAKEKVKRKFVYTGTTKLFNDWNVDGDGALYSILSARAYFDPDLDDPLQVIPAGEQFPMTSPPGFHKAIIADQDTDSQMMSKLFGFQLIMKDWLSYKAEPVSFTNIGTQMQDNYIGIDSQMGANFWTVGTMKYLSHGSALPSNAFYMLKHFNDRINAGQENFGVKMNQYLYNHATKMSNVTGSVQPIDRPDPIRTRDWRGLGYVNELNRLYMKQVQYGTGNVKKRGVLLDLANASLSFVPHKTASADNTPKVTYYQAKLTVCEPGNPTPLISETITKEDMERYCGHYLVKETVLPLKPLEAKITYEDTTGTADTAAPSPRNYKETRFTLEVTERFKKSQQNLTHGNGKSVQAFDNFVEFEFKCKQLGKEIQDYDRAGISSITLALTPQTFVDNSFIRNWTTSSALGEPAAIKNYENLVRVLNSLPSLTPAQQAFLDKYPSVDDVKSEVYGSQTRLYSQIANNLDSKFIYDDGGNAYWRVGNSDESFRCQFLNSNNQKVDQITINVADIINGKAKIRVCLNQDLTAQTNPRRLNEWSENPILGSFVSEANFEITYNMKKGPPITPHNTENFTAMFFESNPEKGIQTPDWHHFVGPRLRVMALMYPAMQKIIDLYNFKSITLDAMKRAFDIEDERNPRYMPSTREMSPFEHRMIRRWLYDPYYNMSNSNFRFDLIGKRVMDSNKKSGTSFAARKEHLRELLKVGWSFELYTIPLYLTAMYTANSEEEAAVYRSVVHDEMKHLFIASNLINAIRDPDCENDDYGPPYLSDHYVRDYEGGSSPLGVYQSNDPYIQDLYTFKIAPISKQVLKKMIAAEFPSESKGIEFVLETPDPRRQALVNDINELIIRINAEQDSNPNFVTIGEHYAQITEAFWELNDEAEADPSKKLFNGRPEYQFTYPQLSHMQEIYSLRTALNQIRLIVEEGEGAQMFNVTAKINKLSHFLKFIETYTECKINVERTNQNCDAQTGLPEPQFTIYLTSHLYEADSRKNVFTERKTEEVNELVEEGLPGMITESYSKTSDIVAMPGFTNVYKKIMIELHYVFNSKFSNFLANHRKENKIPADTSFDEGTLNELKNQFKAFKFKRMENAIAKMRQMTLHARYNVRENPVPSYNVTTDRSLVPEELEKYVKMSVQPNYTIQFGQGQDAQKKKGK